MMDFPEPPASAGPKPTILDRWPSRAWLGILFGIIALFGILSLISPDVVYEQFVKKYWWDPIVGDEGYNIVNTIALIVPLLLLLLWAYRLTVELDERVDFPFLMALLPYLALGSVYRVLEDADLFAPFGTRNACIPGADGPFVETCFGVVFITPIIYVLTAFMAVAFLLIAHQAKRVGQAFGLAKGLQYHAFVLLALVLLHAALAAANPTRIVDHFQNPFLVLLAALVSYVIIHRHASTTKQLDTRVALFSYGLFILLFGLLYVLEWMTDSTWGRGPSAAGTRGWVLVVLVVAPGIVAAMTMWLGRAFANRDPRRPAQPLRADAEPAAEAGKPIAMLVLLVLAGTIAVFVALVGIADLEAYGAGTQPSLLPGVVKVLGGLAVCAGLVVAGVAAVRAGTAFHPNLIYFAAPVNVLMVFGQMADALMTALGIDVYHYSEKHVLPGFLIKTVEEANLPLGLSTWATAIVMLPLKLFIVLLVVWIIDVSVREPRQNLIGLIKLAIIMVGLSPAIRNATRLAMGT